LEEAELMLQEAIEILVKFQNRVGHEYPEFSKYIGSYRTLLEEMKFSDTEISKRIKKLSDQAGLPD
jgi:hypothetical protein